MSSHIEFIIIASSNETWHTDAKTILDNKGLVCCFADSIYSATTKILNETKKKFNIILASADITKNEVEGLSFLELCKKRQLYCYLIGDSIPSYGFYLKDISEIEPLLDLDIKTFATANITKDEIEALFNPDIA